MRMTIGELKRRFGEIEGIATKEPIIVVSDGRESVVILSAEEYGRLKRRDRQVLRAGELSEAEIEYISNAELPDEFRHLDAELNEK